MARQRSRKWWTRHKLKRAWAWLCFGLKEYLCFCFFFGYGLNLAELNCLKVITLMMWKKSGKTHHWDAGAREITSASCREVGQSTEGSGIPLLGRFEPSPWLWFSPYFRLELLLQIANKIQNGALNCEEKLTLAKNTLQAVSLTFFISHVHVTPHPVLWWLKSAVEDPGSLSWNCSGRLGSLGPSGWEQGSCPPLTLLSLSGMLLTWSQGSRCSVSQTSPCTFRVWRSHQTAAGGSPNPTVRTTTS